MDRLQDYFPSHCEPFYPLSLAPRDTLLCRLPLPVQRHLYNHSLAYFNAGYGSGFIYSCAMYPTKRAVVKKTKSTVPGVLSQRGE